MSNSLKLHQQLFIIIVYLSWILVIILSILRNNNLLLLSFIKENSILFTNLLYKIEVIVKEYNVEMIAFFFEQFLKIYIGVLLIYKFNPWTGSYKNFKQFDQKLAWHAGIFLLISTILTTILKNYLLKLETTLSSSILRN